jgi:hypothetical protein
LPGEWRNNYCGKKGYDVGWMYCADILEGKLKC